MSFGANNRCTSREMYWKPFPPMASIKIVLQWAHASNAVSHAACSISRAVNLTVNSVSEISWHLVRFLATFVLIVLGLARIVGNNAATCAFLLMSVICIVAWDSLDDVLVVTFMDGALVPLSVDVAELTLIRQYRFFNFQ